MTKAKIIGLWVVQLLLAAMFVLQGVMKLTGGGGWAERFSAWGYPDQFLLVIGAVELLAGVGVLIPVTAIPAASLIIVVMVGAAVTHLIHGEIQVITNAIMIALCLIVIYGRRDRLPRKVL